MLFEWHIISFILILSLGLVTDTNLHRTKIKLNENEMFNDQANGFADENRE